MKSCRFEMQAWLNVSGKMSREREITDIWSGAYENVYF